MLEILVLKTLLNKFRSTVVLTVNTVNSIFHVFLRMWFKVLWITTPWAAKRASLKKYSSSDAGTIVQRKTLDVGEEDVFFFHGSVLTSSLQKPAHWE